MSRDLKLKTGTEAGGDLADLKLPKSIDGSRATVVQDYESYENSVIFNPAEQFRNKLVRGHAVQAGTLPESLTDAELHRLLGSSTKRRGKRDEFWDTYVRSHSAQAPIQPQTEADVAMGIDRAQEIDSGTDDFTLANYQQRQLRDQEREFGTVLRESSGRDIPNMGMLSAKNIQFESAELPRPTENRPMPPESQQALSNHQVSSSTPIQESKSTGFFATAWSVITSGTTWKTLGSLLGDLVSIPFKGSTYRFLGKVFKGAFDLLSDADTWKAVGKGLWAGIRWLGKTLGEFCVDVVTNPMQALRKLGKLFGYIGTGLLWVSTYLGLTDLVVGLAKTTWLLARALVLEPARLWWGAAKDSLKLVKGEISFSDYFNRARSRAATSLSELGKLGSSCLDHYGKFGSALLEITGLKSLGLGFLYLSQGKKGMALMAFAGAALDIFTTATVIGAVFTGGTLAIGTATILMARKVGWKLAAEKVFKAAAAAAGKEALEQVLEKAGKEGIMRAAVNIPQLVVKATEKGATKLASTVEKKGVEALTDESVERAMAATWKKMGNKIYRRGELTKVSEEVVGSLLTDLTYKSPQQIIAQLKDYGLAEEGAEKLVRKAQVVLLRGGHDRKLKKILVDGMTAEIEKGMADLTEEGFKNTFRAVLRGEEGGEAGEILSRAVIRKTMENNEAARAVTTQVQDRGTELVNSLAEKEAKMNKLIDEASGVSPNDASGLRQVVRDGMQQLERSAGARAPQFSEKLMEALSRPDQVIGLMSYFLRSETANFAKASMKISDDIARSLRDMKIHDKIARDLYQSLKRETDSICELATRQEEAILKVIRNKQDELAEAVSQSIDDLVDSGWKGARQGLGSAARKFVKKGVARAFKGFMRGRIYHGKHSVEQTDDGAAVGKDSAEDLADSGPSRMPGREAPEDKPVVELRTRERVLDLPEGHFKIKERMVAEGKWELVWVEKVDVQTAA